MFDFRKKYGQPVLHHGQYWAPVDVKTVKVFNLKSHFGMHQKGSYLPSLASSFEAEANEAVKAGWAAYMASKRK